MAEIYSSIGLLGVMDRLWYHQIILFSETPSVSFPKNLEKPLHIQDSETCQEFSSDESESSLLQDVCEKEEANHDKGSSGTSQNERPTRLNLVTTRNRSYSSSPSPATDKKYSKTGKYLKDSRNTTSCKSLNDLELEELQGFLDLGFTFRKEHISKRMISVIPGLQRLELVKSKDEEQNCEDSSSSEEEDDKREIARPYLSEAWLIKRPDSPLLNMKIPRISAASDMKKHLKCWAKTVATVVLQES